MCYTVFVPAASQCVGSRRQGGTGTPGPEEDENIEERSNGGNLVVSSVGRVRRQRTTSAHLVKEVPVDKQCVVWLGQLASQKGEEPAHLGGREVWVVHHDLGHHTHTGEGSERHTKTQGRKVRNIFEENHQSVRALSGGHDCRLSQEGVASPGGGCPRSSAGTPEPACRS